MPLRDKLAALTAPCREVDAEIADVFGAPNAHFTASLDATVELVEREMPETWDVMYLRTFDTYSATIKRAYDGEHKLPAVALMLALLEAKGIE